MCQLHLPIALIKTQVSKDCLIALNCHSAKANGVSSERTKQGKESKSQLQCPSHTNSMSKKVIVKNEKRNTYSTVFFRRLPPLRPYVKMKNKSCFS